MSRAPTAARRVPSLRRVLLVGILAPVSLFIVLNTALLYEQTLAAVNTAYDRTLLASAKAIGELLDVEGDGSEARLRAAVPYSALEAFEADNRSRMAYRISNPGGELIDGFADLPMWRGRLPAQGPYAALVDFYDDEFRGEPVRVAVLLQPVASARGRGMAVIQVAETLELRKTLAREVLLGTLTRQALLVVVIALIVVLVVQRATAPVRELSRRLGARAEGDLAPLAAPDAARELHPLLDAINALMARLEQLLEHHKRFVRDASHQLRTPLAVLKTQVQSARRGDVAPAQAFKEIGQTVERATELANQMLALAKVEQVREQARVGRVAWDEVVRQVALDLSPLIAERDLDFALHTDSAPAAAHEWMLRELTRNLLHNAIKHSPARAPLQVRLQADGRHAALTVSDHGPGLPPGLRERLFQPFSAGDVRTGSGLGLAICREIVQVLGGSIELHERHGEHAAARAGAPVTGLDAVVRLPLGDPTPAAAPGAAA